MTAPGEVAPAPAPTLAIDRAGDAVKERILDLVVEKTGYPRDMLDLDLDLEADLGVDTVKQAEMFAAIRDIYQIPRDENRKLRDYPTLAHVIRFVYEKRPDLAGAAPPPSGEPSTPAPAPLEMQPPARDPIQEKVLEIVAEKTGYPKDIWIWISTLRRTSASTRSNRRKCSRRCEPLFRFRATRTSSSATSRLSPTSFNSRATGSPISRSRLLGPLSPRNRQRHQRLHSAVSPSPL
jgi:acyl carrier protein